MLATTTMTENKHASPGTTIKPASEPITPIRDPPTRKSDGNRCRERPPERQDKVGQQAKDGKHNPEDFAFHESILSRGYVVPIDRKVLLLRSFDEGSFFFERDLR